MVFETWLAFFAACWVISLSPGAGAIASMSCGLQYGFWRGYWNALGLQLGLAMQIALSRPALAQFSRLLPRPSTRSNGLAWPIWFTWRSSNGGPCRCDMSDDAAIRPIGKPLALIFRGFLVNISNPKALVFMLAVLPQFIDPHAPLVEQYLILGVTMISVDMIVMAGYTGLASKVLRLLRTPKQQRRMNRTFAGLFIGAAGLLASFIRKGVNTKTNQGMKKGVPATRGRGQASSHIVLREE